MAVTVVTVLFNQQINWIVTLMPLVMVMDFVVKAGVCAHLNIITKRTAPFMDVSYICNQILKQRINYPNLEKKTNIYMYMIETNAEKIKKEDEKNKYIKICVYVMCICKDIYMST